MAADASGTALRGFSWLVHADQWARCAHEHTALLPDGSVELTWQDDGAASAARGGKVKCTEQLDDSSLAFDDTCRAYRSRPGLGRVDVLPPGSGGARSPQATGRGRDSGSGTTRGVLAHPTGLAVDRQQRLYIAETGADAVRVVDLNSGRLLRRVALPTGHPVDVAPDCGRAVVLARTGRGGRLVVLDGRRGPAPGPDLVRPCYPSRSAPRRITSNRAQPGENRREATCPLVLWRARDGRSAIARPDGSVLLELDGATDLDLGADGRLVVAGRPGAPIRDFRLQGDRLLEQEPLRALRYDGGSVAIAPNGRVAFTTTDGYAWTSGSAARRATSGRVVSYRLDSQAYRTRWGRVFVDACLPAGTSLAIRFVTTDTDTVLDPIPATPPDRGARHVPAPEATPPQAPAHLLRMLQPGDEHVPYRRPRGSEAPWPAPGLDARLATYEVPVHAEPGRYLWVELLLRGTDRVSPTVGALRVERPGHALLRTLPRAWSRRDEDAAFLQRFLAPAEGLLTELDQRAAGRAALVNPRSTPSEALAWLASFAALTLDRRWSEEARRTLVAEVYPLFRRRGTLDCLVRLIEIYLGRRPALIETWRLRGLAGVVLGATPLAVPAEVVGGAASRTSSLGRFAVGGRDGEPSEGSLGGRAVRVGDVPVPQQARLSTRYDATAHRFTVLVPGHLTGEQRQVLHDILGDHRPAHTLFEICELGDGMRVGQTLRLDLTAYVGPPPAPAPVVVGQVGIGDGGVMGSPAPGSRLEATSRVGEVRVG
jgi:phage tail-like protein